MFNQQNYKNFIIYLLIPQLIVQNKSDWGLLDSFDN